MPDLTGKSLRQALALLGALDVDVAVAGRGLVVRQTPAPGTPLGPGASCRLELAPPGGTVGWSPDERARRAAGGPPGDPARGDARAGGPGHACPRPCAASRTTPAGSPRAAASSRSAGFAPTGTASSPRRSSAAPGPSWPSRPIRCPARPSGGSWCPDTRRALPRLADAYFGHPSRALTVVGITGTNGKTTTSYLCEALLRARGLATGVIGTIQYVVRGQARDAGQTTPEAIELQGLLAEMVAAGVGGVAMEVSSHALALHRVDGVGVRRGRVHEPDPGPSRLPRDDGGVRGRQAPPLLRAAAGGREARGDRRAQRRRSGRGGVGGRAPRPGAHVRAGRRATLIRPLQHESGLERHPARGDDAGGPGPARLAAHRRAQRDEPPRRDRRRRRPRSRLPRHRRRRSPP